MGPKGDRRSCGVLSVVFKTSKCTSHLGIGLGRSRLPRNSTAGNIGAGPAWLPGPLAFTPLMLVRQDDSNLTTLARVDNRRKTGSGKKGGEVANALESGATCQAPGTHPPRDRTPTGRLPRHRALVGRRALTRPTNRPHNHGSRPLSQLITKPSD